MRIVTRPDFDGIVCAILLKDALAIQTPVKWVEPGDIQKGSAEIREGDIIANLPYDARCSIWFDHHYTNRVAAPFEGAFSLDPSAARVIHTYYRDRFSRDFTELVDETDKIDSADLSEDEVLHPENYPYVLLSMTIKNQEQDETYWNHLVALLVETDIGVVMNDPAVKSLCRETVAQNRRYREQLLAHTTVTGKVSISDFRDSDKAPTGNRFLVFSLFPETVVNVKIHYLDSDREKVCVHLGHSIFNRNCQVNVGLLLSAFEGGGHRGAGAATFDAVKAEGYIRKIVETLVENRPNED